MAAVLLLAGAAGAVPPPDDPGAALTVHLERHPEAEAVDIYKFLHQGIFGPGHMIPDRSAAERYLEHEAKNLEPVVHAEDLCERLGGDPGMVRIHLRPFVEAGEDPELLLELFVVSANEIDGDPEKMDQALRAATAWLETQGKTELAGCLEDLRVEQQPNGFPALHHSERFRTAYKPAYRIVVRDLAEVRGWCR